MSGNIFNQVLIKKPQTSWFDLSFDHKTTLNMGDLVPILIQETLPSDVYHIDSEAMLRLQPMVAPIMHKVDIFIHHFFVPNRINWQNWEKFISPTIAEESVSLPPRLNADEMVFPQMSLGDYLGFPTGDWTSLGEEAYASALPFNAYQKIWWEYYRDQNLQEEGVEIYDQFIKLLDGEQDVPTSAKLKTLRKRAWEHDYFTSCLPWAQKGEAATIPIEVAVPIALDVNWTPPFGTITNQLRTASGTPIGASGPVDTDGTLEVGGTAVGYDPNGELHVNGVLDGESATTTINDLRAAYALQKWLEKNARGGTRYTETLLVHFGVRSSDARLQRPEYIGGSKAVMAISEVLQTSSSVDDGTPQGNMAGHGISVMGSNTCKYYCEEHGFIISILSVRPKTSYFQGVPKFFQKTDRFQYAWEEFANLGEDVVKNKEVYYQSTPTNTNEDTFGYLPRYSEYRYNPSRISGAIQGVMNTWSLHRQFNAPPGLNEDFVVCTPSNRIFAIDPAVAGTGSLIAHVYHRISARRPLPKYGIPSI